MAQPQPYNRQFNFADQQAQTPTTPLPATEVDAELNAVKLTFDQTLANLAKIQRDDGALKNGIVTADSIADSLSIGFTLRGAWAEGVNYLRLDGVTYNNAFWQAETSHLSVAGQTPDTQPAVWSKLVDFNDFAPAIIADGSVTTPKLADGALSADTTGRAKMADGFLSADTTGRAKMADKFVTLAKQADVSTAVIMGRLTAGTGVQEELTPANAKAVLGLSGWGDVVVVDVTTAVAFVDVTIPSGKRIAIIEGYDIPASTSAPDVLALQVSLDGTTFKTGASDYVQTYFGQNSTSVSGGAPANAARMTLGAYSTDTAVKEVPVSASLTLGGASLAARLTSLTFGFITSPSAQSLLVIYHANVSSLGTVQKIRIHRATGNNLQPGSRFTVRFL